MPKSSKISRRKALATLGGGLGAGLLTGCFESSQPQTRQRYNWRVMSSFDNSDQVIWPALLGAFDDIHTISDGELQIEIIEKPTNNNLLSAVQEGQAEAIIDFPFTKAKDIPGSEFITAVPFGMTADQSNAWLYAGNGLRLWRELYAKAGLMVFPIGNTGLQSGEWHIKPVNSVQDFAELTVSSSGMAAQILYGIGATTVDLELFEIAQSLSEEIVDAAQISILTEDQRLNLYQYAKHFYFPGWQTPSATLELSISMESWQNLPLRLQRLVAQVAGNLNVNILSGSRLKSQSILRRLELQNVVIGALPNSVIADLAKSAKNIVPNISSQNPDAQRIYTDYSSFQADSNRYYLAADYSYGKLLAAAGLI